MNEENEFYKVFTKVDKLEKSFRKELDTIKKMLESGDYDSAYPYSLVAEEIAEKIVLLTRPFHVTPAVRPPAWMWKKSLKRPFPLKSVIQSRGGFQSEFLRCFRGKSTVD